MTAGEILEELNSLKITMTDNSYLHINGGVGTANPYTNEIELDYRGYAGAGSYADPVLYENDDGLMGILLHDLGHVIDEGEEYFEDSYDRYADENGSTAGYYFQPRMNPLADYAQNYEAFAEAFAQAAADAFGEDLATYPQRPTTFLDPDVIYNNHMLY